MINKPGLSFAEFVRSIVGVLHRIQVNYAVGGALASSVWGEPRSTMDIDVAIDIALDDVVRFSKELAKIKIYVPPEIMLDNILEDRADLAINAIHGDSGFKAEFFPLRAGDELRRTALQRKRQVDFGPPIGKVFVHSPEDLIVYKLWYYSLRQQTKHTRDVIGIVLSLGDDLDKEYIASWAREKGVLGIWEELLIQVENN